MSARVLFFDIETAPLLGWTWGMWEQNVIDIKNSWYIMSFAYKWMGDKSVTTRALPDYKLYKKDKEDDRELVKELWDLFNQADVIIAHNGDKFDIRKTNARFAFHKLNPPSLYKTVDTLKVARRHFDFLSNKLDALARHLGIGAKIPTTGFHLWRGCMLGDKKAWKLMRRYNANDVVLLERVYMRLRAWSPSHPNLTLYSGTDASCPTCGSDHVIRQGTRIAVKRKYERLQCQNCGRWFPGKMLKNAKR